MRSFAIFALAMMIGGTSVAMAAQDYNSSRSNTDGAAKPADHNTTRSNRTQPATDTSGDVDSSDSDIDNLNRTTPPRDASSGMPTGKRRHSPMQ